ncbi:MAG: WD40 repeat domain-containing protein [Chthonomonadaceae bacterium]|nr:WD40 repeat domain-containing protein [Chthonomonadaceae bacterium]
MNLRLNRFAKRSVVASFALTALGFGLLPSSTKVAKADILVTAGADKKVKIWNPTDGKLIKEIEAHEGVVTQVAVSPDGKTIVTAGAAKKIKIWNAEDGKLIKEIVAHDGAVTCFSVSADSKLLVTGGDDKKVKFWDAKTGKLVQTIDNEEKLLSVGSGGSMTIASGNEGTVKIYGEDGSLQFPIPTNHTGGLRSTAGNPVEPMLYTGGGDGSIKYWSAGSQGEFDKKAGGSVNVMAVSSNGKLLYSGSSDGKVNVWDTDAYTLKTTVDAMQKGGITAMTLSADGKTIFTGGADKTVKIWSADGKLIKTIEKAHDGNITYMFYHADKKATDTKDVKSGHKKTDTKEEPKKSE